MKLKTRPIIHFMISYPTVEADENLSNKIYKALSLCLDEPLADLNCTRRRRPTGDSENKMSSIKERTDWSADNKSN